ncbi:hypothetical protein EDD63_1626 [Breznakia blatticola]|uniref:Immunity protein Imm33 domain-containing protein n=1 Tax=Breznakia blatticola TaxID=1754012 RepID=A0A4R7Z9S3_9FIRM|nr:DUF2185 domain-containing protein [Breznakia blatticola]TDW09193.1 hypothetical protein EDD63_1626 [Breznakia blatticola]
MTEMIKFLENAGGTVVSKNILNGNGKVKWLFREKSIDKNDNGWRILSDIDTDEFVNNPKNLVIVDFNTVANIEPAILGIYNFPIGSDIQLVKENGKISFFDNLTKKEIQL